MVLQCEIGQRRAEDCKVVRTFWCSACGSHILLELASHTVASRQKVLREGGKVHDFCSRHKRFLLPMKASKVKLCPICGKDFYPKRSSGIYCSVKCRRKAESLGKEAVKRRLESDVIMRRCQAPKCDRPLVGKPANTRFCSPACRRMAYYYRKKGKLS